MGDRGRKLTPTSQLVLGMLVWLGPMTSYQLERRVLATVGNFWSFPHSQLYAEPARLAEEGLIRSTQEEGGRRRRTYEITEAGRDAFSAWLAEPTPGRTEVRDPGLLKLFFAAQAKPADIEALARDQERVHRAQAEAYEAQRERIEGVADRWMVASLEVGLRYESTIANFWRDLLADLERASS